MHDDSTTCVTFRDLDTFEQDPLEVSSGPQDIFVISWMIHTILKLMVVLIIGMWQAGEGPSGLPHCLLVNHGPQDVQTALWITPLPPGIVELSVQLMALKVQRKSIGFFLSVKC